MEATELRIGNYFRRMYGHGYEDICEATIDDIIEINTKPWSDHVWFDGIELTEEWVIKLGIKQIENTKIFFLENYLSLEIINNSILCEINKYEYRNIELKHIKYVHQLQNLYFAITGKELKYGTPHTI